MEEEEKRMFKIGKIIDTRISKCAEYNFVD